MFAALEDYRSGDVPWRSGRTWAYVYDAGDQVGAVTKDAFGMYLTENGLDPTAFPSLLRLENEVIAMLAAHLGGDADTVGSFTSGGTESIILAVKSARDRARALRPEIGRPELIVPHTAHAAFQKACHYLDVVPISVPVGADFRADPEAIRAAVTPNTVLIVASAVSYAHGVLDPIAEIAAVARDHDLLFHVDGCIGAFLLPYFRRLGRDVPAFDLSVPGVTSISCDLHKYGFAPKGASVLLYRNRSIRRHQVYACANWSGYAVVNGTVQSAKSGGPLAAAWAALSYIGDEGYLDLARQMLSSTEAVLAGIEARPDLRVLGEPDTNLVAVASDTVDVFHIADEMKQRGWYIQPQLCFATSPRNFHLSINPKAAGWIDEFFADLDASIEAARALPSGHLRALVTQAFADGAGDGLDPEMFQQMLAMVGIDGVTLPERMAPINEVLDAMPTSVREELLRDFMNDLYVPPSDS